MPGTDECNAANYALDVSRARRGCSARVVRRFARILAPAQWKDPAKAPPRKTVFHGSEFGIHMVKCACDAPAPEAEQKQSSVPLGGAQLIPSMSTTLTVQKQVPGLDEVLSPEAQKFLIELHRRFNARRLELLAARQERAAASAAGAAFDFFPETKSIREGDWKVAPTPEPLQDRRVEITGPAEPKMMINALNCGARCFMADLEDSLSPTFENCISGQITLSKAIRREIDFVSPEGKSYKLNEKTAVLLVRPRGWHLNERHVTLDGEVLSGSLFDFGLHFFRNAKELIARGFGPYFYLPKMEHYLEARLWNDVFNFAQDYCGVPRGSVRATCLIETLPAAYQMHEYLYELRDHAAGLNAGRWDYIFSAIKKTSFRTDITLPDRSMITMTVPFMRAYTELLVQTCHRRGAHAMGGMSAFIPSRKDAEVNARAMAQVENDKKREAGDGFDGTWVAHPDLVQLATGCFDAVLGEKPNQKDRLRSEVQVEAGQLSDLTVPGGKITEAGFRNNVSVGIQYIEAWFRGNGAVAIFNLMEDAATAEIARAQLWQWVQRGAQLDDGRTITREFYAQVRDEEIGKIGGRDKGRIGDAADLLDRLVLAEKFEEFLTLPAYEQLG